MKPPVEIRVSFIYDKETVPPLLTAAFRFNNWSDAGFQLWKNIRHLIREHAVKVEKMEGHDMYVHSTDIENALLGVDGIPFGPQVRNTPAVEAESIGSS